MGILSYETIRCHSDDQQSMTEHPEAYGVQAKRITADFVSILKPINNKPHLDDLEGLKEPGLGKTA